MVQIRNQHLLGIALIFLFVATFSFRATRIVADDELQIAKHESASKLVGTWKLEKAENSGSPSGIGTRLKMFNGTHWCVIQPDGAGKIVFLHGGTYDFDGSQLKTKTDFAGELTQTFIGTTGTVKLDIDGDVLNQIDPKGVFNETWRRVTKTDAIQSLADENRRAGVDFPNATELKTGVELFNAQVNRIDEIGKEQSLLTVDEVVAAIRAWDLQSSPIAPELLAIFRNIAEKQMLPPGSSLDFTTGWQPNNEFEYTVWWIDISVSAPNPEKENSKVGYTFRIRDRKLSSRVANLPIAGPERKISGYELHRYIAEKITTSLSPSQP